MRNVYSQIAVCLVLVYISIQNTKGKSLGDKKPLVNVNRNTIADVRADLEKVLNIIEEISEDSLKNKMPGKSRSGIPPHAEVWHIESSTQQQRDVSVVKATALQAAKAVKDSLAATLKTQEGVKIISEGLANLKKCLKTFESTISV